ncbi:MAG TPA: hypothetical protein VMU43_04205 [Candidatus Acidoferrum sp.]|nr:hypothetical protein [Candidatus Acidoferrum sp.]
MNTQDARVLLVGGLGPLTQELDDRLSQRGKPVATRAGSVRDGLAVLQNGNFNVVLATEILPDGRAYELMPAVERMGGNLLVAVALSESALWLPVVERGKCVLGSRALNAHMLASELERLEAAAPPAMVRAAAAMRLADEASLDARSRILARRAAALPLRLQSRAALDARRESFDPPPLSLAAAREAEKEGRHAAGRFERACRRTVGTGRPA